MDWIQRAEFRRRFYRDVLLPSGVVVALIIGGICLTYLILDWVKLIIR